MRDWRRHVKQHLRPIELAGLKGQDEEIVSELAEHLEECYTALCGAGVEEEQAHLQTCAQVGDWEELRRGIALAKQEGTMQDRVRQFWLPSLVTLFSASAVLAVLIWAGVQPLMTHPAEPRGLIVYLPWLLVLPFVGAAGSYLSRRARATGWRVYVAGAFPAVAIALLFLLILPWSFIVDPHVVPAFRFTALAAGTVSWVILPGVALAIGVALQGLRTPRRENS